MPNARFQTSTKHHQIARDHATPSHGPRRPVSLGRHASGVTVRPFGSTPEPLDGLWLHRSGSRRQSAQWAVGTENRQTKDSTEPSSAGDKIHDLLRGNVTGVAPTSRPRATRPALSKGRVKPKRVGTRVTNWSWLQFRPGDRSIQSQRAFGAVGNSVSRRGSAVSNRT